MSAVLTTERPRMRQTTSVDLSATFLSPAGVVLDPGAVTVTVTSEGTDTAILTGAATGGTGAAARTLTLTPAQTAALDLLRADWTSPTLTPATVRTYLEIVGAHLFTVAEARAFDKGGVKPLALAADYPDPMLVAARDSISDDFQRICGVAFESHAATAILDGNGNDELLLPHRRTTALTGVATREVGGSAWTDRGTAGYLLRENGLLIAETASVFPAGRRNVRATYVHGHAVVPGPIARAALMVAVARLVPSNIDWRAIEEANQFGTFRLAAAGLREAAHYGIPEVDAILERFCERLPGVG